MKPTPIAEILRRIRPLAKQHQISHLRDIIASEQGGNIYRTSVRIRELQAALKDILNKQLKRESKAA
jgi:hypothetical protein